MNRRQPRPTSDEIANGGISGFTASKKYVAGKWAWCLRGSGNTNHIYAVTQDGTNLGKFSEPKPFRVIDGSGNNITNGDWEDMACSEEGGTTYLWILDHRQGTDMKVLKVTEPDPNTTGVDLTATCVAQYVFNIPDASPGDSFWVGSRVNNVEAMFYYTSKIHIIMKQQNMDPWVYRFDVLSTTASTLTKVGTIPNGEGLSVSSISADGKRMLTARSVGKVKVREGTGTDILNLLNGRILLDEPLDPDNIEAGDFYPYGSPDFTLIGQEKATRHYRNS